MFLQENSNFPPDDWTYWYDKYDEYCSWYSGDPNELLRFYSTKKPIIYSQNIFWQKIRETEDDNAIHMPAAGDIASMSSNLLFSEKPEFNFDKKTVGGERLKLFIEDNNFYSLLLEAAEMAAALSGVFLKLEIDTRLSKTPIVSIITPLAAFPTFIRGRLWEVLFYREVKTEKGGTVVYRLFENRKRTVDGFTIEYKLYKGTKDKTGKIIDINAIEETASLGLVDIVYNKVDGLGVVYVPNMRPNRLQPGSPLGINDYAGVIGMMDSLDLSYSSWIRDIELGMGQIFVDEELLQREETSIFGTEKSVLNKFSKFQKCFMKLNLSNQRMSGTNVKPIESVQFEMRTDEHLRTCEYFFSEIVSQCGYSPSGFGLDNGGNAESGRALRMKERKSLLTREKKSSYWLQAINKLFMQVQQLDNSAFPIFYNLEDVKTELQDSIIVDSGELSETIRNLDQAMAISTLLKVKMQHPDWSDEDIDAEVKRINEEKGVEKSVFDVET